MIAAPGRILMVGTLFARVCRLVFTNLQRVTQVLVSGQMFLIFLTNWSVALGELSNSITPLCAGAVMRNFTPHCFGLHCASVLFETRAPARPPDSCEQIWLKCGRKAGYFFLMSFTHVRPPEARAIKFRFLGK